MRIRRLNEMESYRLRSSRHGPATLRRKKEHKDWQEYNKEISERFDQISKNSEIMLEAISRVINRTLGQTKFLFVLCDMNIYKYMKLEEKIKNNHISHCPVDEESVDEIILIEKDESDFFEF